MSIADVAQLEKALGGPLPDDYREFLSHHHQDWLEPRWLVRPMQPIPGSGDEEQLDALLTARKILADDLLSEPGRRMLVIGDLQPGGYLYMCFDPGHFGAIYARYPYQDGNFYLIGNSFSEFQARCRPQPGRDA